MSLHQCQTRKEKTITPLVKAKKGKTTHYTRFDTSRKELQDFAKYLKHPDGGLRPEIETGRIISDVNKFLCFANTAELNFGNVLVISKLRSYIEKLKSDDIGPDGIITKLQRLEMAVKYMANKEDNPPSQLVARVQFISDRLTQWRSALRKGLAGRTANRVSRMEELSTDVSHISDFLNNEELCAVIARIRKGTRAGATVTGGLINVFTAFIFVSLAYKNAQRPGSVVNMTLKEFKLAKAVTDDNNEKYYKVRVADHKTAATYGGVTLIITEETKEQMNDYITYVRPLTPNHRKFHNVLLSAQGNPIRNYSLLIKNVCTKFKIRELPSLTDFRKVTATKAVESCNKSELTHLQHHMTHSEAAATRYYQAAGKTTRSIESFKKIQILSNCK